MISVRCGVRASRVLQATRIRRSPPRNTRRSDQRARGRCARTVSLRQTLRARTLRLGLPGRTIRIGGQIDAQSLLTVPYCWLRARDGSPGATQILITTGATDMRRGMHELAALLETTSAGHLASRALTESSRLPLDLASRDSTVTLRRRSNTGSPRRL